MCIADEPSPSRSLDPGDHRALAARLDLLHFQDEAPGMIFWHPDGWVLYRLLEEAARRHVVAGGYREVRTPQLIRRPIWEQSGHWAHFHDGMFAFGAGDMSGPDAAALKPVSCPGHIQIVKRAAPSWRDLPLRLAEMGLCHRDEESGALHGLFRLRQFTQDDGHIFCADDPSQVAAEIEQFCRAIGGFYASFGFDRNAIEVALATRPGSNAPATTPGGTGPRTSSAPPRARQGWIPRSARAAAHSTAPSSSSASATAAAACGNAAPSSTT